MYLFTRWSFLYFIFSFFDSYTINESFNYDDSFVVEKNWVNYFEKNLQYFNCRVA